MEKLTEREEATLKAVIKLTKLNGYPPSQAEIAEEIGTKPESKHNVRTHLLALARKGRINYTSKIARGIKVLETA